MPNDADLSHLSQTAPAAPEPSQGLVSAACWRLLGPSGPQLGVHPTDHSQCPVPGGASAAPDTLYQNRWERRSSLPTCPDYGPSERKGSTNKWLPVHCSRYNILAEWSTWTRLSGSSEGWRSWAPPEGLLWSHVLSGCRRIWVPSASCRSLESCLSSDRSRAPRRTWRRLPSASSPWAPCCCDQKCPRSARGSEGCLSWGQPVRPQKSGPHRVYSGHIESVGVGGWNPPEFGPLLTGSPGCTGCWDCLWSAVAGSRVELAGHSVSRCLYDPTLTDQSGAILQDKNNSVK